MDQLKYSLRSVEMYIPWARHVYIVTNGQGMDFVAENIFAVKKPGKTEIFSKTTLGISYDRKYPLFQ